jgi:endonuclease/exonuclease/phosphatase family metal-dependent hydrolase
MIDLVTFNILSDDLTEWYESTYEKEYLDKENRYKLLRVFLANCVQSKKIILLQEVTLEKVTKLSKMFNDCNYTVLSTNYGNSNSGFMGILIAIPSIYDILEFKYVNIGKNIETWDNPLPKEWFVKRWLRNVKLLKPRFDKMKTENKIARFRQNRAIFVTLKNEDGKTFDIINYHMPCKFRQPMIQMLHYYQLLKLTGKNPFIIGGDFNIQPNSKPYLYITGDYKPSKLEKKYKIFDNTPLVSVYKQFNGFEPKYTNWCTSPEEFKGCLDYFFIKKHSFKIKDTFVPIIKTKVPNFEISSDHISLSVLLSLNS